MAERQDPFAGLSASIDPRQNLVPRLGILGVNLDQRIAEMLPVRAGAIGRRRCLDGRWRDRFAGRRAGRRAT